MQGDAALAVAPKICAFHSAIFRYKEQYCFAMLFGCFAMLLDCFAEPQACFEIPIYCSALPFYSVVMPPYSVADRFVSIEGLFGSPKGSAKMPCLPASIAINAFELPPTSIGNENDDTDRAHFGRIRQKRNDVGLLFLPEDLQAEIHIHLHMLGNAIENGTGYFYLMVGQYKLEF